MRWRLPGSKLFKELELTFGDWVALGDWFENIADVKRIMRGEPLPGEEKVGIVEPDKAGTRPTTARSPHVRAMAARSIAADVRSSPSW